jgi:nicotinamidase/pyrazinamidase
MAATSTKTSIVSAALLLIDIQPDFMPGGALPVGEGDLLVEPAANLVRSGIFETVVATQDWHPPDHISFASNHKGRLPFDQIDLYGYPQTLWPDHCVQGSPGADIHIGVPLNSVSAIIRKGTDPLCDSYSAFRNNWNLRGERSPTGLAGFLRERGVRSVFVCGLARDFCVKWTAEDAADDGFATCVLWDLTRAVAPGSDDSTRDNLISRGVQIIHSSELGLGRWNPEA